MNTSQYFKTYLNATSSFYGKYPIKISDDLIDTFNSMMEEKSYFMTQISNNNMTLLRMLFRRVKV